MFRRISKAFNRHEYSSTNIRRGALIGGVIGGTASVAVMQGPVTGKNIIRVPVLIAFTGLGGLMGGVYPISLPFCALVSVNYMFGIGIQKYLLKNNDNMVEEKHNLDRCEEERNIVEKNQKHNLVWCEEEIDD